MIDILGPISFWKAFTFWLVAPKGFSFRSYNLEIR